MESDPVGEPEAGRDRAPRERRTPAPGPWERVAVTVAAVAVAGGLALEGGGYDPLVSAQAGVAIWWLLALALAFRVVPRARQPRESTLALGGLIALTLLTALALLGTESDGRTYEELARLLSYGGLAALIAFAIGASTWRSAADGIAIAALAIPVLALVSRLAPDLIQASPILEDRRLAYPLGYWNALACWAAAAFALGLSLSTHRRSTAVRAGAMALLPVAATCVYLTYSRAGVAVLAAGVAVVLAAGAARRTVALHAAAALLASAGVVLVIRSQPDIADGDGTGGAGIVLLALLVASSGCAWIAGRSDRLGDRARARGRPRSWVVAALAVAALATLAAIGPRAAAPPPGGDILSASSDPRGDDPAARLLSGESTRRELWSSALAAFESQPLTGTGPGTFQLWWERDGRGDEAIRDAHSLPLETAAELGLPGLIALAAVAVGMLLTAARSLAAVPRRSDVGRVAGLLAAAVVVLLHAAVDWLWEFPALVALALGAALVAGAARATPGPGIVRGGARRAIAAAACVVAGALIVPPLVAENRGRAALDVLASGQLERAAELADDAVAAEPWDAEPRAIRAEAELARGLPDDARADALAAIEREPGNWRHRLLLARVELAAGDEVAARAALSELVRIRPVPGGDPDLLLESLLSE